MLTASAHVDPARGGFPTSSVSRRRGRRGKPQRDVGARYRRRRWVEAVERLSTRAAEHGADALVVALGVDAAAGDPESPLAVTADGFRAAGRQLGALGVPTVIVQEGGYDLASVGGLVLAALTGFEEVRSSPEFLGPARGRVARRSGIPVPERKDLSRRRTGGSKPSRPRSGRARSRSAPTAAPPSSSRIATRPTSGCSTSTAACRSGSPPGATLPFWEDTEPRLSPDGSTVAYADQGPRLARPAAGGPPRKLVEAGSPVWIDDRTLVVTWSVIARAGCPSSTSTTRGRGALAAADEHGDEGPRRSHRQRERRLRVHAAGRPEALGDPRRRGRDRRRRALTARRAWRDASPAPGRPTAPPSRRRRAARLDEIHLVGADGSDDRQLTHDDADFSELEWHPDGDRLVAVRGRRGRFDLVAVDAASGAVTELAAGGTWGCPHWTADGVVATYRTTPRHRSSTWCRRPRRDPVSGSARDPLGSARGARGGPLPVHRRPRDPGVPVPPAGTAPSRCPRSSTRTAARRRSTPTSGTARPVLPRQGLRLARDQLPWLDHVRPRVRAAEPRRLGSRRHPGLPGRGPTSCARSTGSTAIGSRSSAPATAPTWRCCRSRTTRSTATAAPCASTATATSSPRGRREIARCPGPRADDGPAGRGARRLPGRLPGAPARARAGADPDRPRRSSTSGSARSSPRSSSPSYAASARRSST